MGDPLLDEEEFHRWRDEADAALRSAHLQTDAGLHNWSCFSLEQAAHLAMKAILHGLGRGPGARPRAPGPMGDRGRRGRARRALRRAQAPGASLRRGTVSGRPCLGVAGSPGRRYGEADARQALEDTEAVLRFIDEAWSGLRG